MQRVLLEHSVNIIIMSPGLPDNHISDADFGQLFSSYRPRLFAIAFSYLQDEDAANDIVTDSFIYFWESRKRLSPDVNVAGYILVTLKHMCLNYLRDQKVHSRIEHNIYETRMRVLNANILSLESSKPEKLYVNEVEEIVDREVNAMPSPTREIFIKSRFLDKKNREIADELNIQVRRVEYEIAKAMKILRRALTDYLPLMLPFLLISIR